MLSEKELLNILPEDLKLFFYDVTDSTNNEAKRIIKSGESGQFIVIAKEQTCGRGRQGKSFFSPKDTGLYMTLCLPAEKNAADFLYLTSASAVAVCEAILSLTGKLTGIKWVNDIYLDGKKICGILTESVLGEKPYIIIGIGINLTTASFPEEINNTASSLNVSSLSASCLAIDISKRIIKFYKNEETFSINLYRKYSIVLNKDISYVKNGEAFEGFVDTILDSGALLVKRSDGIEEILDSGEISLRLK